MATKNRHRINIWITDEQYKALHRIKEMGGGSLNETAQDGVGNQVAYLIREIHTNLLPEFPWAETPSRP